MTIDIEKYAKNISLNSEKIWQAHQSEAVSYSSHGHSNCLQVEDNSFWFQHRNRCITELVDRYHEDKQIPFWDIGGGNGVVSIALQEKGFVPVLVEPGQTGAQNARQRGIEHVIQGTTTHAGITPGSLGSVGLFDVVEHIEDDVAFCKDIGSLLTPGGLAFITVPAYGWLWSDEDVVAGHYRRHTVSSISRVLRKAGFKIEYSTYIFSLLPAPILLLRTIPNLLGLKRKTARADAVAKDHNNSNATVGVLNRLLELELKRIKRGKSIPFGGSCLIVARRTE